MTIENYYQIMKQAKKEVMFALGVISLLKLWLYILGIIAPNNYIIIQTLPVAYNISLRSLHFFPALLWYGIGQFNPGPRFTNGFSIAIQIRWKFRFTLTSTLILWSLQNFVHGTTAVLSWHVQKFVAIWWPASELWQGEVFIVFELRAKKR